MKRSKLEMLSTLLRDYTFEEVVPSNIMDSKITDSGEVEYLVEWMDGTRCSFKYHFFKIFVLKDSKKVGSANSMFRMILFVTTMMA